MRAFGCEGARGLYQEISSQARIGEAMLALFATANDGVKQPLKES
jgi:hypothetical protein